MNARNHTILEVCVASVEDAVAACRGGADRIELNVGLELGGLTPSIGLLEEVKRAVDLPVVAMVRPKPGGFCYTPAELRLMMRDAEILLAAGADGIVCGALRDDGSLDQDFWFALKQVMEDRELIFHRAVDIAPDPRHVIAQLIDLGTTRVLTSGGCDTAWQGREKIAGMQQSCGGQIEILPGSGITAENAVALIRTTGCRQIHGSFSRMHDEQHSGWLRDDRTRRTCQEWVAAAREALNAQRDT